MLIKENLNESADLDKAETTPTIRLLIADDHAVVRQGLVMVLSLERDIVVCGEAGDGRAAIEVARATRPTVCLLDYKMPFFNGIQAGQAIQASVPGCRVLILTGVEVDETIFEALESGIDGYILKQVPPAELIRAIRAVANGGGYLDATVTRKVLEKINKHPDPPQFDNNYAASNQLHNQADHSKTNLVSNLSEREREVLSKIAIGQTTQEIAEELCISNQTVRTHIKSIFRKLEVTNRAGAVTIGLKQSLIVLDNL